MALKKCRLCYFPVAFCREILQHLLSFIFWKGAVDKNKNLNTDTAALKGKIYSKNPRRTDFSDILCSGAEIREESKPKSANFFPNIQQTGWGTVVKKGVQVETQRSPGVPLLLLTGWSLDQG